jgi:hypothetical protein
MRRITADEFEKILRKNPAWATTLTEPVEITGRCYLFKSPITHLSPLLHFGVEPYFASCDEIEVAVGTYRNGVSFRYSDIASIGNPAWATTLTEPVEVDGYVYLYQSPITHLSRLLHLPARV